ncbi:MAG: DedA family protein [Deltaproteobacteria bacterium]|nr:DedA family protein [Deltaproteobacteria bacterium]
MENYRKRNKALLTEDHQSSAGGSRRRIWMGVGILLVLLGMAAVWRWTPLADEIEIGKITGWAFSLRTNPARPAIILAAYLIGSLISFPVTVLILATALVFGPTLGMVYSFAGCLLGSVATYALGYFLGRDFVRRMTGSKWEMVERKITQSGILAVATLRLIPIAPFTVINVISGAFQVPFRDYILGSLLGLAPGIVVTNLFAHQLQSAIRNPGAGSFVLLGILIAASVWGAIWVRRRLARQN